MIVNLLVQIEYDAEETNEDDVADAVEAALAKSLDSEFAIVQEVVIVEDDELEDN